MSEPNDPKLKRAVAEMLDQLAHDEFPINREGITRHETIVFWRESGQQVLETEWLYIVSLAEKTLSQAECYNYSEILGPNMGDWKPSLKAENWPFHATFNQRATALCQTKGITI